MLNMNALVPTIIWRRRKADNKHAATSARCLCGVGAACGVRSEDHRGSMCSRCGRRDRRRRHADGAGRRLRALVLHAGYCGDGDSYRRAWTTGTAPTWTPRRSRATKEAEAQRNARYDATFVRTTRQDLEKGRGPRRAVRRGHLDPGRAALRHGLGPRDDERELSREALLVAEARRGRALRLEARLLARVLRRRVARRRGGRLPVRGALGREDAQDGVLGGHRPARARRGAPGVPLDAVRGARRPTRTCVSARTNFFSWVCSTASRRRFSACRSTSAQVLELRTRKYAQYLRFGRSHRNVLGARYEDLTQDPEFLFRRLKALGYACNARDDFKRVKAYAKFGGAGSGAHFKPPANHSGASPTGPRS